MRQVDVFQRATLTFQSPRVCMCVGVMYVCVCVFVWSMAVERRNTTKRIWQQQHAPGAVSSDNTPLMREGGSTYSSFPQ